MRLAAIDLGTVTSRLLLADVDEHGIHEVQRQSIITHLGIGVDASGLISFEAILRETEACQSFLETIAQNNLRDGVLLRQLTAVATSAMRDAANASLVQAALSAIGVDVEIIAGEREARLSFMGTLSGFADTAFADKTVISVDVGGGSTELVVGDTQAIRKLHSFDIGSRRVTERFLQSDPPTSAEIDKARQWIQAELAPFFSDLLELGYQPQVLLAVAGTATTALTVSQAIEPYDPTKVHGATMDVGELQIVIDRLATLPLQQRRAVVGLEPARASVVIGGLLVLDEVLGAAGLGSFTVSETDILHGILLDAYHSQAV